MASTPENIVIHLIGFPGVGKYTVAKEIAKRSGLILMDNQLINNPILNAVGADGKTKLPTGIWEQIGKIRNAVLDTIEHIAPRHLSYVMTNAVLNMDDDRAAYEQIVQMFQRRGSRMFPVILHCDLAEHEKRIVTDIRKERFKDVNPDNPKYHSSIGLLEIDRPDMLKIDITSLPPNRAADLILDHVSSKLQIQPTHEIDRGPQ
jgi:hypothetical protein